MIDVTCPKCGGMGRAPREKVNTRLVCKKCHALFHISPSGRTLLGDPPLQPANDRQRGRADAPSPSKPASDWKDSLPEFTMTGRSAVVALIVLVVGGAAYFVMTRPGENLADRAKVVAQDFADGGLDRLKSGALSGTVDELVQWYGQSHRQFEELKKEWAGREVLVGVLVIEENPRLRSGQVTAILAPSKPSARDASLHGSADVGGLANKPVEIMFYFTPDAWGKWRVDGKKMLERSSQPL
ncbi:MAG: hypothetical protein P4L84_08975 [Isosphaeraceae bacterium]|nr:hypothetical protein [Isosphaeraceae bacterium]